MQQKTVSPQVALLVDVKQGRIRRLMAAGDSDNPMGLRPTKAAQKSIARC
jgi:hypothetical protein